MGRRFVVLGALVVLVCGVAGQAMADIPAWTTYHRDALRSGFDPDSTSPAPPTQLWQTPSLDGQIYGQPLVYGGGVFVVTENDSVYALNAATGATIWQRSIGTPVPDQKTAGCGDIGQVGITSTPVIDPSTNRIYVVGDTWDGSNNSSIHHVLAGFDVSGGTVAAGFPETVDPPGSQPAYELQRAALALDAGKVIIGYGGNDGGCGPYHGWLVAAPENGGPLQSFEVDASDGHTQGAIWGGGNGPAIDPTGNVWVATGNGSSGTTYDGQESVLKLDSNLNLLDHWTPSDWTALDTSDTGLGSTEPLLLPNGLVFQIGKGGIGYLLSASSLGGTGARPLFQDQVCAGAYGGEAYSAGIIYVPCSDGLRALSVNPGAPSFQSLPGWSVNPGAEGPPIIAGGLVWSASAADGSLYGLDPATGATRFSANLGTVNHFTSPSAAGGRLFVADGAAVSAFTIASSPPPTSTTTALASTANPAATGATVMFTATVSPAPDAGTVSFTDGGIPIPGCVRLGVSAAGLASCPAIYDTSGSHAIVASYSGDSYFAASQSTTLTQAVRAVGPGPTITHLKLSRFRRMLTIQMTLSAGGKVTISVARLLPGHISSRRCRLRATRGRRCTFALLLAARTVRSRRGRNTFHVRLKALPPGAYGVTVLARDALQRASRPLTLRFTVR